jgi:hypothetical protein
MKPHKIEHYRSVLDAVAGPGCPLCRYMRNYQAKCIQGTIEPPPKGICNFHAWALAAIHDRLDASRVFLYLLSSQSLGDGVECDICLRLQKETAIQLQFLAASIAAAPADRPPNFCAEFCISHGRQLCERVPAASVPAIENALEQYRERLIRSLRGQQGIDFESSGWGVLGHAAEFLKGQRGLYR